MLIGLTQNITSVDVLHEVFKLAGRSVSTRHTLEVDDRLQTLPILFYIQEFEFGACFSNAPQSSLLMSTEVRPVYKPGRYLEW